MPAQRYQSPLHPHTLTAATPQPTGSKYRYSTDPSLQPTHQENASIIPLSTSAIENLQTFPARLHTMVCIMPKCKAKETMYAQTSTNKADRSHQVTLPQQTNPPGHVVYQLPETEREMPATARPNAKKANQIHSITPILLICTPFIPKSNVTPIRTGTSATANSPPTPANEKSKTTLEAGPLGAMYPKRG